MLRHVALICIIYCIIDMICTVACQEIEVVIDVSRFFPPLPLSQFCQTDCKKQFIKNLLSNSAYGISKTKDKFITTTINTLFIHNKTPCTNFNARWQQMVKHTKDFQKSYVTCLNYSERKTMSTKNAVKEPTHNRSSFYQRNHRKFRSSLSEVFC